MTTATAPSAAPMYPPGYVDHGQQDNLLLFESPREELFFADPSHDGSAKNVDHDYDLMAQLRDSRSQQHEHPQLKIATVFPGAAKEEQPAAPTGQITRVRQASKNIFSSSSSSSRRNSKNNTSEGSSSSVSSSEQEPFHPEPSGTTAKGRGDVDDPAGFLHVISRRTRSKYRSCQEELSELQGDVDISSGKSKNKKILNKNSTSTASLRKSRSRPEIDISRIGTTSSSTTNVAQPFELPFVRVRADEKVMRIKNDDAAAAANQEQQSSAPGFLLSTSSSSGVNSTSSSTRTANGGGEATATTSGAPTEAIRTTSSPTSSTFFAPMARGGGGDSSSTHQAQAAVRKIEINPQEAPGGGGAPGGNYTNSSSSSSPESRINHDAAPRGFVTMDPAAGTGTAQSQKEPNISINNLVISQHPQEPHDPPASSSTKSSPLSQYGPGFLNNTSSTSNMNPLSQNMSVVNSPVNYNHNNKSVWSSPSSSKNESVRTLCIANMSGSGNL